MSSSPSFTRWRDMTDKHAVYRDITDAAAYHWRIDEGAGDTITCEVTGEVGTINGATWTADTDWVGGYGLQFDASNWVQFDIESLGDGEDFMWVSVAFEDAQPNSRGILASVVDTSDPDRWNLESGSWDQNGSIGWWMSGDNNITSGSGTVVANTKHHTVGIHGYPNDHREIQIDGESMDTTTADGTVPGGDPTTFKIGRRGAGSREFVGVVGEVMIGFTELDEHDKQLLYERQPFASAGGGE